MLCAVLYLLHRRDVLVSRQVRVVRANGCVCVFERERERESLYIS
jgi:hypothetical protein